MTLKQETWVCVAVLAVGAILVFFVEWLGALFLIAGFILDIAWIKCPTCGTWVGRYPGEYCRNCGEKLPWNEKK